MARSQEIKKVWTDDYKIHSYEVDTKGSLSFPMLCRYMQESAWHHAENLGVGYSHLVKHKLTWVLSQQLIKIEAFPRWGETIRVRTWPSGRGRLSYFRDFRITGKNDESIAVATTKWYAIDWVHRKPQNIDFMFDYDISEVEQACAHEFKKLRPLDSPDQTKSFQVGYGDLDVNEHVNNIKYIEWILEGFSLDFHKSHRLKEIEINFLAEAVYADRLVCKSEERENSTFYHSLVREGEERELCRARTEWD